MKEYYTEILYFKDPEINIGDVIIDCNNTHHIVVSIEPETSKTWQTYYVEYGGYVWFNRLRMKLFYRKEELI